MGDPTGLEEMYREIVRADSARGTQIRHTPLVHSPIFSRMTGSDVYLKSEFQQKTGSFKIRGAYYKITTLGEDEKRRGVVAASAGNHAQGVAYAASVEGIPCTIVMPKNASPAKVAATRGYGANVVLHGTNYEESWARVQEISRDEGAVIIHAFDDPQVIAAQGVIGLEILEDLKDVDEVYVPIGGGGLAAGVLVAIKKKRQDVRVIGVQSESFPAMRESLRAGALREAGGDHGTIADGISVKKPGTNTFAIIRELIDDIVTVNDEQIIRTIFLLMERSKMVVEAAGAVALAHMLAARPAKGKKVVAVLAGGNIDMYLLGQIVDKGLASAGRLLKISVMMQDRPGAFLDIVREVSAANANIVEVVHDRLSSEIDAGAARVTLNLEMQDQANADILVSSLKKKGIRFRVIS